MDFPDIPPGVSIPATIAAAGIAVERVARSLLPWWKYFDQRRHPPLPPTPPSPGRAEGDDDGEQKAA